MKIFSGVRKRLARAILIDRATPDDDSFIGRIARERSEENYRFAGGFVKGKTILDIGGGAGIGHSLLFQGGAVSIVSIDPYAAATRTGGDPRFTAIREDFLAHSFDGNQFDVIICLGTIFYIRDADAALSKMQRLLRPGGLLIMNCINQQLVRAYFKMSLEEVDDKFSRAFDEREFSDLITRHFGSKPAMRVQQPVSVCGTFRFWLTPATWPFRRHPVMSKPEKAEGMFLYAVAHNSVFANAR